MKKYIVEAPEPKSGQKVSSGGIRENGKLKSQFKNPVPYDEPILPTSVNTQKSINELASIKHTSYRKKWISMYLRNIIWQEIGEPLLCYGLRKLGNNIIEKIESSCMRTTLDLSSSAQINKDTETDEVVKTIYDAKIINFPKRAIM